MNKIAKKVTKIHLKKINIKILSTGNITDQLLQLKNNLYTLKERFFKTLCAFVNLIVAVGILQLYFAVKKFVLIKKYFKEAI